MGLLLCYIVLFVHISILVADPSQRPIRFKSITDYNNASTLSSYLTFIIWHIVSMGIMQHCVNNTTKAQQERNNESCHLVTVVGHVLTRHGLNKMGLKGFCWSVHQRRNPWATSLLLFLFQEIINQKKLKPCVLNKYHNKNHVDKYTQK